LDGPGQGWNLVANLGTQKDKRYHSNFVRRTIDRYELDSLYTDNWIAGKTVDIPVEDGLRNWRQIKTPSLSPAQIEEYETEEERLQVREFFGRAGKWARLYGGSVILLGIDGAGPLDSELKLENIKKGALKFLHVIDRHDLSIEQVNNTDPTKANFRLPEFYRLMVSTPPGKSGKIMNTGAYPSCSGCMTLLQTLRRSRILLRR
jgi:phage-related protein (TIGR01555 family)